MFKKFVPKYHFKSIYDIDYKALKDKGIKYIMFDLDNTLIPYHETLPTEDLIKLKEELIKDFKIIIVSNSKKNRVSNFADALGVKYIKFAKKPLKKGFILALHELEVTSKKEVLFVGDQLLTDIYGANRMKLNSVLVDPVNRETEAFITKFNRKIEKIFRGLTKLFNKNSKAIFNSYSEVEND